MQAGRELDALVAEKVMGADRFIGHFVQQVNQETKVVTIGTEWTYPPYSTKIEDAWQVVEKIGLLDDQEMWREPIDGTWCIGNRDNGNWIKGTSAAHAICLAALKALNPL